MARVGIKSLAAGVMIAGTVLVSPAVSQAALSQCNGSNTCLWGNNGFDWFLTGKAEGQGYSNLTSATDNRMDSWANRSVNFSACGRTNINGGGDGQTFQRNSNDDNVNPWNSDEVSSYRTNGSC